MNPDSAQLIESVSLPDCQVLSAVQAEAMQAMVEATIEAFSGTVTPRMLYRAGGRWATLDFASNVDEARMALKVRSADAAVTVVVGDVEDHEGFDRAIVVLAEDREGARVALIAPYRDLGDGHVAFKDPELPVEVEAAAFPRLLAA